MTSILISRFILNLRNIHLAGSEDTDSFPTRLSPTSNLRFASAVVGNLGAPLDFEGLGVSDSRNSYRGEETEEIRLALDPLLAGMTHGSLLRDDLAVVFTETHTMSVVEEKWT